MSDSYDIDDLYQFKQTTKSRSIRILPQLVPDFDRESVPL